MTTFTKNFISSIFLLCRDSFLLVQVCECSLNHDSDDSTLSLIGFLSCRYCFGGVLQDFLHTSCLFFGFHLKGRKLLGKLCDIYGNLAFPLLTFSPAMWPTKLQLAILDTLFEVTFSETVVGATFLARLFSLPRSESGMRVPHQHGLVQHLVRGVGAELHDLLVRDPHQAVPLPFCLHRCKTVRCSEHSAAPFFSLEMLLAPTK